MSDLISRQAVIDLVSKFIVEIISEGGRDLNAHTNDILRQILRNVSSDRVLPSVENKGEWIPVTERLPEEEHEVYCQLSDGSNAVLYVQDNWGQMEWVDGLMGTGTYDVIAWREKPEPYTEGE